MFIVYGGAAAVCFVLSETLGIWDQIPTKPSVWFLRVILGHAGFIFPFSPQCQNMGRLHRIPGILHSLHTGQPEFQAFHSGKYKDYKPFRDEVAEPLHISPLQSLL